MEKNKFISKLYFLEKFKSKSWRPFSKLIIRGDGADWVLTSIANEMKNLMSQIGIETLNDRYYYNSSNQCVFYTSKYEVLNNFPKVNHRIAFPYFHGMPESSLHFKTMFDNISKNHEKISKIQVSHSIMEKKILETGIDVNKIHKIPISINYNQFSKLDNETKKQLRFSYGIPRDAIVIGSFQKDGEGWGRGLKPKLIKGPDIFIESLKLIKKNIPEVFVLLSGPARGYVIENLIKIGIPYKHINLPNYIDINKLYNCLDLYIVSSREEGGPRSILECMATGVPILSTKVGQAIDLINHDVNGWLVDISDIESIADKAKYIIENKNSISNILDQAQRDAESNSYENQKDKWKNFMRGFVD